MTHISQYKLDDNVLERLFQLFFEIVGKREDREEFHEILIDILSPVERIMIAKRIAIIYLLMKQIDYTNICKVLKVSTATVAKFNLLMEKSRGVVPLFKKIVRNEKMGLFLMELFNDLFPPGMPGVNWKAAWERKKRMNKIKTFGI